MSHRVGVCSWSIAPASPGDLVERVRACGLHAVQLALDPIRRGHWDLEQTRGTLADAGIEIRSGMMAMAGEDYSTLESIARTGGVRPDERWEENLAAAERNAEIAASLGLSLVTFHAGFIPEPGDPEREAMTDRVGRIARAFEARGVRVGLETGQETASSLRAFLSEPALRGVGVNFDPANMLLYGSGEPIDALSLLGDLVVQTHLKDAMPPEEPGIWGTETPAGEGRVDWDAFFGLLSAQTPEVDVIVEREAGADRADDVIAARKLAELYGATA